MKFFFMKKNMWYAELVWLSLDLSSDMTHLHARQCYIVSRRNESCWERTFVTCQFIIVMSHCLDITDVHARSDYVVSRVNESRHEKNDAICQVRVIISLFVLWHDSFTCQTILCCVSRKWVMLGKNVCQIKMYHCYPAVSCDMTDVHARSEHIASQTKWVMSWKQLCDMPSSYYDFSSCPMTILIYIARDNMILRREQNESCHEQNYVICRVRIIISLLVLWRDSFTWLEATDIWHVVCCCVKFGMRSVRKERIRWGNHKTRRHKNKICVYLTGKQKKQASPKYLR